MGMLLRVAALGVALTVTSVASASPMACNAASFETAADFRAWPAWLRDPCWHHVNSPLDIPNPPARPLAMPDIFSDSSDPDAALPSPAEATRLPSHGFDWEVARDAPAVSDNVAYGDNPAVYHWVARITGGAQSPQRVALDRMTQGLHLPMLSGGPATQMLALGMLIGGVVLRRRHHGQSF